MHACHNMHVEVREMPGTWISFHAVGLGDLAWVISLCLMSRLVGPDLFLTPKGLKSLSNSVPWPESCPVCLLYCSVPPTVLTPS